MDNIEEQQTISNLKAHLTCQIEKSSQNYQTLSLLIIKFTILRKTQDP